MSTSYDTLSYAEIYGMTLSIGTKGCDPNTKPYKFDLEIKHHIGIMNKHNTSLMVINPCA